MLSISLDGSWKFVISDVQAAMEHMVAHVLIYVDRGHDLLSAWQAYQEPSARISQGGLD